MSQGPYHWYQSRSPPVLHHDSEKESTARKRWGADEKALGDRRGSARGPITGIHWIKLPSITPLMKQPTNVTPLTKEYRRGRQAK